MTRRARPAEVIEKIGQRSQRDPHEPRVVTRVEARETFGDIRRGRFGCAIELRAEIRPSIEHGTIDHRTHPLSKLVAELPHLEVFRFTGSSHAGTHRTHDASARTTRMGAISRRGHEVLQQLQSQPGAQVAESPTRTSNGEPNPEP
jgi:hypothetical protein